MSNVSPESEIFLKSPHFSIRSQDIFSFTAPQSREGAGYNPFCDLECLFSMTQLLSHTIAHFTGSSFMLKANNQPYKKILVE